MLEEGIPVVEKEECQEATTKIKDESYVEGNGWTTKDQTSKDTTGVDMNGGKYTWTKYQKGCDVVSVDEFGKSGGGFFWNPRGMVDRPRAVTHTKQICKLHGR